MSQSASSKKTTMTLLTLRGSSESASHSLVMAGLPLASCSIRQDITASPSCLRGNILSNWSLDRDCLLCVTGCKNNVLAGILQNRISLNDQNESLSVFKLMKMIVKWTAKQLFVTSQVDETDQDEIFFVNLHLPVRSNLGGVEQPIERVLTLPPECQLQQNQQWKLNG